MTSESNEHTSNSDGAVDGGDANSPYEPKYSEPSFETSSPGTDWEVPASAEGGMGEAAASASAPDASPLMDGQVGEGQSEGQGQFWNEGGPVSGATSNSRPVPPQQQPTGQQGYGQQPYGQQAPGQQAPGQQAPWGPGPQQPYQSGSTHGGMPPQPNYGGPMAISPEFNNPNYLAGPSEQGRSTLQLDYWLSVFFSWIPALIFYLTEKDKNKLMDEHTKELLNFNITRIIVGATMVIPVIGTILGGIASLALFIIAILGAIKGPDEYGNGRLYKFPLAIRFIK